MSAGQITPWGSVATMLNLRRETRMNKNRHGKLGRQIEYLEFLAEAEMNDLMKRTLHGLGPEIP